MSATAERFPQTFADVCEAEVGTCFCDEYEDGVRFIILRGPGSLCAYLGVPKGHPLADYDYDSLPLDCHGGLTYSGKAVYGDGDTYWYGWDYSHLGDKSTYDVMPLRDRDEHEWTPAEVYADSWLPRLHFARFVALADRAERLGAR